MFGAGTKHDMDCQSVLLESGLHNSQKSVFESSKSKSVNLWTREANETELTTKLLGAADLDNDSLF